MSSAMSTEAPSFKQPFLAQSVEKATIVPDQNQAQLSLGQPLSYEKVVVRAGRIELSVRVNNPVYRMTNKAVVDACLVDFPDLAMHTCHNSQGPTFTSVMYHTPLPHLLEHLIVSAQLRAYDANTSQDVILTGTTQWSAEDPLVANVSISFKDDLVGLTACKEMLAYLNNRVKSSIAL